jgi:hypothetical protein
MSAKEVVAGSTVEANPDDHEVTNGPPGAPKGPKTPLGRRLWEIRARIVASGEPLLGWKEIEREVADRRGGHEPNSP